MTPVFVTIELERIHADSPLGLVACGSYPISHSQGFFGSRRVVPRFLDATSGRAIRLLATVAWYVAHLARIFDVYLAGADVGVICGVPAGTAAVNRVVHC